MSYAVETCYACNGHGVVMGDDDARPTWCRSCDGGGMVRARDEKGRFLSDRTTKVYIGDPP